MYNYDFHSSIESEELPQARRIAEYIRFNIPCKKFIDFGSSTGIYVREMKNTYPEVECIGYEFSDSAVDKAVTSNIILADLTEPLDVEKKDSTLGLCLEVLEHIDDAHWSSVLENITKLSDIIIFSAARPGQGGTGHINCRPKLDWIRRFHSLGWVVDHDKTTHFLSFMTSGYHMGWLRNNAIVLVKA